MLPPVCLPVGVAGPALFSIFIFIRNLYFSPLLPSPRFISAFILVFFSLNHTSLKVGDADIVCALHETIYKRTLGPV